MAGCVAKRRAALLVSVFASVGVRNNAVWAGDQASYHEGSNAAFVAIDPGAIHVIFVQAQLEAAVLPRIFNIVAEVKAD